MPRPPHLVYACRRRLLLLSNCPCTAQSHLLSDLASHSAVCSAVRGASFCALLLAGDESVDESVDDESDDDESDDGCVGTLVPRNVLKWFWDAKLTINTQPQLPSPSTLLPSSPATTGGGGDAPVTASVEAKSVLAMGRNSSGSAGWPFTPLQASTRRCEARDRAATSTASMLEYLRRTGSGVEWLRQRVYLYIYICMC